jgi:predicted MPP superfamily phosphohydrolase
MVPTWLAALIFFSMLGLIVLSQVFWFWRAHRFLRARRPVWLRWVVAIPVYLWFAGILGLFLLVPLRWFWLRDSPVLVTLLWQIRQSALLLPMGLWITASMFSFLLVVFVRSTAWLVRLFRRTGKRGATDDVAVERRYFLQTATYAAGALPFVMVGYGFLIGRQNYQVHEVEVPILNLPPQLDGLRLLQLTDVHASAYMPVREVRRIADIAREVEADLVLHTGDFLTTLGDPLEGAVAELARVEGHYGSFGCLGNHEIYAGASEAATDLFAQRGVRILRGENAGVEIDGARVNLIGVDYQRQPPAMPPEQGKRFYLRDAERLVRPDAVNILLSHNPNPFFRAADLDIELTLAGHTHGGQVQVEILDTRLSPARFMTPFINGLYERQGHQLYVSRGLGTVGAPIRINVPPEITLLTLRRGRG